MTKIFCDCKKKVFYLAFRHKTLQPRSGRKLVHWIICGLRTFAWPRKVWQKLYVYSLRQKFLGHTKIQWPTKFKITVYLLSWTRTRILYSKNKTKAFFFLIVGKCFSRTYTLSFNNFFMTQKFWRGLETFHKDRTSRTITRWSCTYTQRADWWKHDYDKFIKFCIFTENELNRNCGYVYAKKWRRN